MSEEVLEIEGNDILLRVKVSPNSSKFEIGEVNRWRDCLEISLSSEPKRGEANRELLDELKSRLEKDVGLVQGVKSRDKRLRIKNISKKEVYRKLNFDEGS